MNALLNYRVGNNVTRKEITPKEACQASVMLLGFVSSFSSIASKFLIMAALFPWSSSTISSSHLFSEEKLVGLDSIGTWVVAFHPFSPYGWKFSQSQRRSCGLRVQPLLLAVSSSGLMLNGSSFRGF
jgi:hypothetical protein